MDIVRFKGGLGNQMFQFAFYQSLKSKGREVKASLGYYDRNPDKMPFCLTEVFPEIHLDCVSDEEFETVDKAWREIKQNKEQLKKFLVDYKNRFFWVEGFDNYYRPAVFETQNCVFVGYWQSEKYFREIRNILLEDFRFSAGETNLQNLCCEIKSKSISIAVHIRRGDYLKNPDVWGNLSENDYYERAIHYFEKRFPDLFLVFFSDDIQWVKKRYIYKNAVYIESGMFEDYKAWYDLYLMTCCTHNVIANSSFSWWGAWLNRNPQKNVVAPGKWFLDGRIVKDNCPDEWIIL